MSASRLQRRACAPEPRARGRSALPKRTNSSIAFSCTSLDASLLASPAPLTTSFSPPSSSSPSPPTSPEDEPKELDLPPAVPEAALPSPSLPCLSPPSPTPPTSPTSGHNELSGACTCEPRDHTTPYPREEAPLPGHFGKHMRVAEFSMRRSTGARSPLATTSTLPADLE